MAITYKNATKDAITKANKPNNKTQHVQRIANGLGVGSTLRLVRDGVVYREFSVDVTVSTGSIKLSHVRDATIFSQAVDFTTGVWRLEVVKGTYGFGVDIPTDVSSTLTSIPAGDKGLGVFDSLSFTSTSPISAPSPTPSPTPTPTPTPTPAPTPANAGSFTITQNANGSQNANVWLTLELGPQRASAIATMSSAAANIVSNVVKIDGQEVVRRLALQGEVNAYDIAPGAHTIEVVGTDGYTYTSQQVTVAAPPTLPPTSVTVSNVTAYCADVEVLWPAQVTEDYAEVYCVEQGQPAKLLSRVRKHAEYFRVYGLTPGVQNAALRVVAVGPSDSVGVDSAAFNVPATMGTTNTLPTVGRILPYSESALSIEFEFDPTQIDCIEVVARTSGQAVGTGKKIVLPAYVWQGYITGLLPNTAYTIDYRCFTRAGALSAWSTIAAPVSTLAAGAPTKGSLFWFTPQRLQDLQSAQADYVANPSSPLTQQGRWFKVMKARADTPVNLSAPDGGLYGETGECAAIMYVLTQDPAYAVRALGWLKYWGPPRLPYIRANLNEFPNNLTNFTRDRGIFFMLFGDMIRDGLTVQQRQELDVVLKGMIGYFLHVDKHDANGGVGMPPADVNNAGDGDQIIGTFFALQLASLSSNPAGWSKNCIYDVIAGHPMAAGSALIQFGGPSSKLHGRESLTRFVTNDLPLIEDGGIPHVSSEYNFENYKYTALALNAMQLACALRGDNVEYYPRVRKWLADSARAAAYLFTVGPSMEIIQWGDEERPTLMASATSQNYSVDGIVGSITTLAEATRGLIGAGDVALGIRNELLARTSGYLTSGYDITYRVMGPPSGAWAADRSDLPLWFHAKGMHYWFSASGWGPNSCVVFQHHMPDHKLDHYRFINSAQMWRNSEWVFKHSLSYVGITLNQCGGNNGLAVFGHSGFGGTNRLPGANNRSNGSLEVTRESYSTKIRYKEVESYGTRKALNWWGAEPLACFESNMQRLHIVLSNADVYLEFDRVFAANPKLQTPTAAQLALGANANNILNYSDAGSGDLLSGFKSDRQLVNDALGLVEWFRSCPVEPTFSTATRISYSLSKNAVTIDNLLPLDATRIKKNNAVEWAALTNIPASQKYWQIVRHTDWPTNDQPRYHSFFNVTIARDVASQAPIVTLLQSSAGHAVSGALIQCELNQDTIVLFNDNPTTTADLVDETTRKNSRNITAGFTIQIPPTTTTATLELFNMAQGTWRYSINGGALNMLPINALAQGRATISLTGSAAKTMVFTKL